MSFFSRILLLAAIIGLITTLSVMIPANISDSIDNSIIYVLSFINNMGFFIDVGTLFICIAIIGNFIFSSLLFLLIVWIFHLGK